MISFEEFVLRAHVERQSLHAWIAAGWIVPPRTDPEPMFSDVDLARVQLIRDLREDFGVNDEGVAVILHLLDQCTDCAAACTSCSGRCARTERPAGDALSRSYPRKSM